MFRAFSVFSGRNSTVGFFYHRTHRTGCARHRTHRRFLESTGFDFSVFSVPRSGFSVFSGQKRLARRAGFTTEHTERATPDTEHTEDLRKARGSTSVYSVCREAASVCSVAKTAGTEGGIPQNTQKIFRKHGVRISVYSVCRRRRLQCVQWPRLLARREGFTTEHTERLTPSQNTQKGTANSSVCSVSAEDGISVISGSENTVR